VKSNERKLFTEKVLKEGVGDELGTRYNQKENKAPFSIFPKPNSRNQVENHKINDP
jgi:hypothetical protein